MLVYDRLKSLHGGILDLTIGNTLTLSQYFPPIIGFLTIVEIIYILKSL